MDREQSIDGLDEPGVDQKVQLRAESVHFLSRKQMDLSLLPGPSALDLEAHIEVRVGEGYHWRART